MVKLVKVDKPLFVIISVLRKKIRTHQDYWSKIQKVKHPEARLSLKQTKKALRDSSIVYKSKQGKKCLSVYEEFSEL